MTTVDASIPQVAEHSHGALPFHCRCGTVHGWLKPVPDSRGTHLRCYCGDCQDYIHYLGEPDAILDAHAGTTVYQTSPARLQIEAGIEQLRAVRLSERGILRWYADCCRSPIANTLATGKVPFIGLVTQGVFSTMEAEQRAAVLGPVAYSAFSDSALGNPKGPGMHRKLPLSAIFAVGGAVLRRMMRGDQKRSPLFDADTGVPIAAPMVLSEEEREELRRRRSAWHAANID